MHTTTVICLIFFFNDTATTEIYTLSLHDALPIFVWANGADDVADDCEIELRFNPTLPKVADALEDAEALLAHTPHPDRKSTRLNSSHANISYAVFCLKKITIAFLYTQDAFSRSGC